MLVCHMNFVLVRVCHSQMISSHLPQWWQRHIILGQERSVDKRVFASSIGRYKFPPRSATPLYINMMPIIIGKHDSIPEEYRHYVPLLSHMPINAEEWNKVGYLTIDERSVEETRSQRRPGLHIDAPPSLIPVQNKLRRSDIYNRQDHAPLTIRWGRGEYGVDGECGIYRGGIYMLSDVSGSTRVWNVQIKVCDVIEKHINHKRIK